MFCLASQYQTSPDNLSQVTRIFNEQAIPLVSRQPGFRGVFLMAQPHGTFMVLNIWENKEQAEAWPQNPEHQQVVGQLKPLLSKAAIREGYGVLAYHVSKHLVE